MAGTDSSKSIHFQSPIIILKNIQLEEKSGDGYEDNAKFRI